MSEIKFRPAVKQDLPAIVALLADDVLGASRESTDPAELGTYERAFDAIVQSGSELFVGERAGEIVATAQLTVIPGLSYKGATRAQIEEVRVASALRGRGIGAALIGFLERRAVALACGKIQLTSSKTRERAHVFYERLGYVPSHVGFKKGLR